MSSRWLATSAEYIAMNVCDNFGTSKCKCLPQKNKWKHRTHTCIYKNENENEETRDYIHFDFSIKRCTFSQLSFTRNKPFAELLRFISFESELYVWKSWKKIRMTLGCKPYSFYSFVCASRVTWPLAIEIHVVDFSVLVTNINWVYFCVSTAIFVLSQDVPFCYTFCSRSFNHARKLWRKMFGRETLPKWPYSWRKCMPLLN